MIHNNIRLFNQPIREAVIEEEEKKRTFYVSLIFLYQFMIRNVTTLGGRCRLNDDIQNHLTNQFLCIGKNRRNIQ